MKFRYPLLTHRTKSLDQTSTLISYVPSPSFSLSVSEPSCPAGPSSSSTSESDSPPANRVWFPRADSNGNEGVSLHCGPFS